jgi:ABC-2 type transport system permease protein
MEKFAMIIISLLKHPIKWWGADYNQIRIILKTKLSMDFRRSPSMFRSSGQSDKTFNFQLIVMLMFGLFIAVGFKSITDLMLNLTICFSVIMVMLGMSIINEFTSVLFDHRDNHIILVRPVSDRTLLLARLLHIQVFIGFMVLALSIIPSIIIAIKYGVLTFFAFWIAAGLCSWITLLLTSFFYIALSKVVSGERFKDLVSYFQIFMAVIIFGGYQFVPRFMESQILQNSAMQIHWWSYLIPPIWLAGFVDLFNFKSIGIEVIVLSFIALFASVAGAVFLVRNLSNGFVDVLSEGAIEKVENNTKEVESKTGFSLIRFFCVSEIERTGWRLAMSITKRDRKFKQAVYPSFGIIFVMVILMIKPDFSDFAASFHKVGETKNFFLMIFFCFFGTTAIMQLPYTDTPEGAWLYKALPIKDHGHILTGAIKAMLLKFFVPTLVFLFTISLTIWGVSKLPSLLIGSMSIILINQYSIIFMKMELPFTQARDMQQRGANMSRMMLLMLLMGVAIGFVYLSTLLNIWIVLVVIILLFLMIINAYSQIRKRNYFLS